MGDSLFKRAMKRWSSVIVGHTWTVLLVALLMTLLSGYIVATQFDIRSDIKDLMPANARSVEDTFAISDRMGSITSLSILVEAPDRVLDEEKKGSEVYARCVERAHEDWRVREARAMALEQADKKGEPAPLPEPGPEVSEHCDDPLILFSAALVDALNEMESVGYVHYRKRRDFFEDNLLLYASVEDLERLYEEVDLGLGEARKMSGEYKACRMVATEEGECDSLEPTLELLKERRLESNGGAPSGGEEGVVEGRGPPSEEAQEADDFKRELMAKAEESGINFDEYMIFQLSDGAWAAKIQVRFRDGSTSLKANKEHLADIEKVVEGLQPESFHEGLKVAYGGGFRTQQEEADAIVADVKFSGGLTVAAMALLLFFFFRRIRALFTLLVPLTMSIAWTFALTFATIGYLNLITAFIAAILLGLGIDFGIHLLVRFDQERALGKDTDEAMRVAIAEVGAANTAGAATTAATFLTLTLADFRGFSQFGVVACLGVLLALVAMLSVLPALAVALQRVRPTKALVLRGSNVPSTKGVRWLRPVALGLGLLLLVTASYSVSQVKHVTFEDNFYRLGMRTQSWKKDADRYKVTQGKRHSSPAIMLMDSLEEVSALEKVIRKRKDPHKLYQAEKVAWVYPNLFSMMASHFGAAMVYTDDYSGWPLMAMASRVSPREMKVVPRFQRYDSKATQALWKIQAFEDTYPALSQIVERRFSVALEVSDSYRVMGALRALKAQTPEWLEGALPSRRLNDKLTAVRDFASIYSFMPGTKVEQQAKLEVIERLRERTKRRSIRFLPKKDQAQINTLRRYLVRDSITVDDLPEWVKLQFKEGGTNPAPPREGSGVDYAFGNVGLAYQSTSSMIGEQAHRFTGEMRSLEIAGANPTMATNAFVFSDMLHQIVDDGLKVAGYALIIVLLVVFLQFRDPLQTFVVVAPLAVALTWVAGLLVALDIKLGLFNLVMLPVIIGIGIDNGIHLYHRYRENGRGGLFSALRFTGGSIVMTSMTTMVGFGGLTLSQHMGLNSMGELALVGIGACLVATLTIQPALLVLAEKLNLRRVIGTREYSPQSEKEAEVNA